MYKLHHLLCLNIFTFILSYYFFSFIWMKENGNNYKIQKCNTTIKKWNKTNNKTISQGMFDRCKKFYIDMGSNIGVQIRKLYQPEYYPNSPVLQIFDNYFGPPHMRKTDHEICAVGFEMNPRHTQRLNHLKQNYDECGFKTYIFTETAVSTYYGNISFQSDNQLANHELGASVIYNYDGQEKKIVKSIDIADFLMKNVLPYAEIIVSKMDIEGEELNVLPHLLTQGVLCKINIIFMEPHERMMSSQNAQEFLNFQNNLNFILTKSKCKVEISNLDDESYLNDETNDINSCILSKPSNE